MNQIWVEIFISIYQGMCISLSLFFAVPFVCSWANELRERLDPESTGTLSSLAGRQNIQNVTQERKQNTNDQLFDDGSDEYISLHLRLVSTRSNCAILIKSIISLDKPSLAWPIRLVERIFGIINQDQQHKQSSYQNRSKRWGIGA